MDNKIPTPEEKQALTASFGRKKTIKPQGTLLYPDSAEREYVSLAIKHLNMYRDVLKKYLPEIEKSFRQAAVENPETYHEDAKILGFSERFSRTIRKMEKELSERLEDFQTDVFIKKVAKRANANNIRQWQKLIKKTFGIELDGHYYNKGTWADLIDRWTEENVGYVKSIPTESLGSLRQIIQNGYHEGWGITKLRNEIAKEFSVSKSKAKSIAIDQMGTLCAQITRKQQTDAGCTRYRWKSRHDNRVRDSHRQYNGKIFEWDNPPPAWYMTKSRGRVYTGRNCHPGEDYCCRCMAIPVFDNATINLPLDENGERRVRSEINEQEGNGIPESSVQKNPRQAGRRR